MLPKKTQVHDKNSCRNPKVHQLHAGPMYAQNSANHSYSKESSSDESFAYSYKPKSIMLKVSKFQILSIS